MPQVLIYPSSTSIRQLLPTAIRCQPQDRLLKWEPTQPSTVPHADMPNQCWLNPTLILPLLLHGQACRSNYRLRLVDSVLREEPTWQGGHPSLPSVFISISLPLIKSLSIPSFPHILSCVCDSVPTPSPSRVPSPDRSNVFIRWHGHTSKLWASFTSQIRGLVGLDMIESQVRCKLQTILWTQVSYSSQDWN